MPVYQTVKEMTGALAAARRGGLSIGLVPTMGALHEGHASLIRAACAENDYVVVSVFVNPTQFAPAEDLSAYPRDLEKDRRLAEAIGARAVFAPSVEEMYPEGDSTWVEVGGRLTGLLCGRSRPTHFRGVTTVMTKFFNIIRPDRTYFGQKDGQQAQVMRRLLTDLFLPVELKILPIVREKDDLALSSRNIYLSEDERRAALVLSRSLKEARGRLENGERSRAAILDGLKNAVQSEPLAVLDYAEIYNFPDLGETGAELSGQVFIGLAVKFSRARLIDNIVVDLG
ncbi:MAG: pantoate--beta-alanine ligase [Candidatus Adiutrix sp.]|jgi:pantoate--beta-alanine ligase|nr:pantoate--beta-alanine ligase [Candidatus Adiutrix sp.]